MKSVPFTVRVNVGSPTTAEVGEIEVVVGTGLVATAFTVKSCALDCPPPGVGLETRTLYPPAVSISLANMTAVT